jgi:hypothetical protein
MVDGEEICGSVVRTSGGRLTLKTAPRPLQIAVDASPALRVAAAFTELAHAI